jgi:hypothetical protein
VKIPKHVKDKISKADACFVATADKSGTVHLAAAKGLRVVDDESVAFKNWFCFKTMEHLKENPSIAIGFLDPKTHKGFQLLGKVEAVNVGAILDGLSCQCEHEEAMTQYPQEEHELIIRVQHVLDLNTGPHSDQDIN